VAEGVINFEPASSLARARELRDRETLSPAGVVVDSPRDVVPGDAALEPPLVVDLDGTLLRSDLLVESFSATVATRPLKALGGLLALRDGKAALKARLAQDVQLDFAPMPWNEDLLDLLAAERARGRRLYLASAADRSLVEAVAAHFGFFDGVFASDGTTNLSGSAKAAALCAAFGEGGFDYAGNDKVDLKVWEKAAGVLVVNANAKLARKAVSRWPNATVLGQLRAEPRAYIKAMRVHQWAKNLLLVMPMLGAHLIDTADVVHCLIAFMAFSLCASSVYLMNDLADLARDRRHRTKRPRPFAAGTVPMLHGLVMIPILLVASFGLAVLLPPYFVALLAIYYGITVAYSMGLKRQLMVDVVVLSLLYGIRLYAGAVAVGVPMSAWLGAFSMFLFTSLALIKRSAELADRSANGLGDPSGRDYRLSDLPVLEALAAASGFTAVLVMGLYVSSDAVRLLYSSPNRLFLICSVLVYWLGRILVLTHRNEMHEDPVFFAVTDRASQVCALLCLVIFAASL
jgi:4-hydroxybenzoate polyprenyltransferase/phosphoserine phosphatase